MRKRNIVIGAVIVVAGLAALGSTVKPTATTPATSAATTAPVLTGQVVFGTTIDSSAMTVAAPITTAKLTDLVGWVAYFTDAAKSTSLTLTLAQVGSGGAETPITTTTVDISNPQFNELGHVPDNALASSGSGTYTIRYIRPSDATVLATGTITLTK